MDITIIYNSFIVKSSINCLLFIWDSPKMILNQDLEKPTIPRKLAIKITSIEENGAISKNDEKI